MKFKALSLFSSGPTRTDIHNIAQTRSDVALWAYWHWTR